MASDDAVAGKRKRTPIHRWASRSLRDCLQAGKHKGAATDQDRTHRRERLSLSRETLFYCCALLH